MKVDKTENQNNNSAKNKIFNLSSDGRLPVIPKKNMKSQVRAYLYYIVICYMHKHCVNQFDLCIKKPINSVLNRYFLFFSISFDQ